MTLRVDPWRRIGWIALAGTLAMAAAGGITELWRFGLTVETSHVRVERAVRQSFAAQVRTLRETTDAVAQHPHAAVSGTAPASRARLFALAKDAIDRAADPSLAVTVYDGTGTARAWAGRPSEIPATRILGEQAFFAAPGPLGLRLVHVVPILADLDIGGRRVGTAVGERVIAPAFGLDEPGRTRYLLAAPITPVQVRAADDGAGLTPGTRRFALHAPDGDVLLEAAVTSAELDAARDAWRRVVAAAMLVWIAGLLVAAAVQFLTRQRRDVSGRQVVMNGVAALAGVLLAYGLLWIACELPAANLDVFDPSVYQSNVLPDLMRMPADLLLAGLLLGGLGMVVAFLVDQARLGRRTLRRRPRGFFDGRLTAARAAGGLALVAVTLAFDTVTSDAFEHAGVDLLHVSLYPWDAARLSMVGGLLLLGAATLWSGAALLVASQLGWRINHRRIPYTAGSVVVWLAPGILATLVLPVSAAGFLAPLAGSVAAAAAVPFVRPWFRHASQAARMLALFLALLVPTLLAYPALFHNGAVTAQATVEQQAPQAAAHPVELQRVLARTLEQIDDRQERLDFTPPPTRTPDTDRAFGVWRQTDLAGRRLTSAVELYAPEGGLISRFALNFPESAGVPQERRVTRCTWDVFGEIAPFGSDERRVLHAERAICTPGDSGTPAGAVVVHVALDYTTLPFISSANPYTQLFQSPATGRDAIGPGRGVELVVYGWGRQPLFSSGPGAWAIPDRLFERSFASREPFWTTLDDRGSTYAAYFVNNREGIYVLGYPVFGPFEHLVHLAELSTLAGLLFVLLTLAVGAGRWLLPLRPRIGRALLREVRTSFYRRLLLAFIAATVIPVLALAVLIRGYFTAQLRAGVEAGAVRTAAVAQRVIEESLALQQVGQERTALINDDLLVWIGQVLDEDVNIFVGSQLVATSERDLFASGLLPTRTPAAVFASVVLERQPGYVMEDTAGGLQYLVASTPIQAAGPDAVLTLPLASQQQEIEQRIANLDRGILLAVTVFILLGAGGGLYMAERIADPVHRLTRATRQVALGNFDARVAVRSADELQRLVTSFNTMADDLKRQQVQLERTHRLEAWADMAREVAHEIKNPLTPVQLSAEHLLQVHADRGEPLGPVLRRCVDTVLTQVRLLRRIAADFASYAAAPKVSAKLTAVGSLVSEVLDPYRVGLEERIDLKVAVPADLPQILIDRALVGHALTNIVENAIHAMPDGGALTVRAAASDGGVTLAVSDSGVGLDRATLSRMFDPYFSTKATGTGLGMMIAKRNVELNRGTIAVESTPGHGTTITLTFPVSVTAERAKVPDSAGTSDSRQLVRRGDP